METRTHSQNDPIDKRSASDSEEQAISQKLSADRSGSPGQAQLYETKYFEAKGQRPVSLEPFRALHGSKATGSNKSAKRLTDLMHLTVDTSFYFRYRSALNPDFGAPFPQIVDLVNVPGIPNSDLPPPTDPANGFMIQFIANVAGFHFASI